MSCYWRFGVVQLAFLLSVTVSVTTADVFTATLAKIIQEEQVLEDQPYVSILFPEKLRGLYNSYVFQNLHGKPPLGLLRHSVRIFDNNLLSSSLVTIQILEAYKEGTIRPTDLQIEMFVETLRKFKDGNRLYNNSIMGMYHRLSGESNLYGNYVSRNYLGFRELLDIFSWSSTQFLLNLFDAPQQLQHAIFYLKLASPSSESSGCSPPDFDNTLLNLALGAHLHQLREEFPRSWRLWKNQNTNLTSVFDALKKYAYRPFSKDANSNSIDPRSHYYLRGYLDQARAEGRDVALITSWVQSVEEARQLLDLGLAMPFLVNNVDVAIGIDAIYGICVGVLSGIVDPEVLDDPDIEKILLNTTSLVAYEIAHNFSNRPDLAICYYPISFNFFMFVAKTVEKLHSARLEEASLPKPLESVYQILREAVDGPMTNTILSQVKKQGSDQFYFEEFLGNGDTLMGVPVIKGEDRIFTTASAVNALISIWTECKNSTSRKYTWRSGTSDHVKEVVAGCVQWLRRHTLSGQFPPYNAICSTTSKGFETLPFWYPGNRLEYLNGSTISDFSRIPTSTFVYAYQGYLPADQYTSQVNQTHFGMPTPTNFHGFNGPTNVFTLWNTVAYTYATTLLAVAKYDNVL